MNIVQRLISIANGVSLVDENAEKEKKMKFKYPFKDGSTYFYLNDEGEWITDNGRKVTPSEYRNYLEHTDREGRAHIESVERSYKEKGRKYEVDPSQHNFFSGSQQTDYNDLKYIKQLGLNIIQWHEFKKRAGEILGILDETDPPEEFDKMYEPIMNKLKEIMVEVKKENVDEDYDKEVEEEVIPYSGKQEVEEDEEEEEECLEKYILKDYLENNGKSFEELKMGMPANLRDFFREDVMRGGYDKFMSGMVGKTSSSDLWKSMVMQVRSMVSSDNIRKVVESGSNEEVLNVYKKIVSACKYLFGKCLEQDDEEDENKIAKLVNMIEKYAKMIEGL